MQKTGISPKSPIQKVLSGQFGQVYYLSDAIVESRNSWLTHDNGVNNIDPGYVNH